MSSKNDSVNEAYKEITELLAGIKKEADLSEKVDGLGAKLTAMDKILTLIKAQYKTGENIDKMIWSRIAQNEKNNNKNRINWAAIFQTVIGCLITGAIFAYFANKGAG